MIVVRNFRGARIFPWLFASGCRFLDHIFGIRGTPQHPIGDGEQQAVVRPQALRQYDAVSATTLTEIGSGLAVPVEPTP